MALQRDKYRTKGNVLDDEFFNKRFFDIDLRLHGLEVSIGGYSEAVDALIERGLEQINTQLQASLDVIKDDVDGAEDSVAALEAAVADVEEAIAEIVGGSIAASSISVVAISGVDAEDVQAALEEHQSDIESLQNELAGLGDVRVVADMTEAGALTDLGLWDVVHVQDDGSGSWVRYQVVDEGDGTWGDATKVLLYTEGQQPVDHVHAIDDVTGLQSALDGKADDGHGHIIDDVTGLQTALDGKADDADIPTPATKGEAEAGTDAAAMMTPLTTSQHVAAAKAWVIFNGTTASIVDSLNVSSLTDNGVGDYETNLAAPMANSPFSVGESAEAWHHLCSGLTVSKITHITKTGGNTDVDPYRVSAIGYGDLA